MPEPDYNRLCARCAYGYDCSQPYEAADGAVYECKRIIPPRGADVENTKEGTWLTCWM